MCCTNKLNWTCFRMFLFSFMSPEHVGHISQSKLTTESLVCGLWAFRLFSECAEWLTRLLSLSGLRVRLLIYPWFVQPWSKHTASCFEQKTIWTMDKSKSYMLQIRLLYNESNTQFSQGFDSIRSLLMAQPYCLQKHYTRIFSSHH